LENRSQHSLLVEAPDDGCQPDSSEQSALPFDEPFAAPAVRAAPPARCQSCGGPALEEALCASCERAFHTVLEVPKEKEIVGGDAADHAANLDALFKALEAPNDLETASASFDSLSVLSVVAFAVDDPARGSIEPAPPLPAPADARAEVGSAAPATPPAEAAAPAAKPAESVPHAPEMAAAVEMAAVVAPTQSAKGTTPDVVAPARQTGRFRSLLAAAAVLVIVGAIGIPLTKLWLGRQQQILEIGPTAQVSGSSGSKNPAGKSGAGAIATPPRKIDTAAVAPAPPVAAAPDKAKRPARVQPRASRTLLLPAPEAASIAAPDFVNTPPVEAALPAAEAVRPTPLAAPPPASPVGPFYETRSVDRAPQVLLRVEPQMPGNLQGQGVNEIVIVRVLVSQAGHPALVSLLRRSKSGLELDNAVIAAVKRWTFAPAVKRGEAVSCYMHIGVTVGRSQQ
jgi:protein TonB